VIKEESIRLNQIVTEFLDFARPQTPIFSDCALEDIIGKNLTFIQPELDKKGITIQHNLNGKKMRLRADQELLYQAFLNIFINAIQAMKDSGSIYVNVDEHKGNYLIEIKDSGHGVTREQMKKIFDPFFTTKEKGTGLGLSIVRKIIEGHNGMINLESKEGEGTKVIVQLPKNR
jgi:signal transduction histidine kinase